MLEITGLIVVLCFRARIQLLLNLTTLHQFFEQMECDDKLISEVDVMIEEVKSPSTVDFSTISNTEEAASVEQEEAGDENDIAEKEPGIFNWRSFCERYRNVYHRSW